MEVTVDPKLLKKAKGGGNIDNNRSGKRYTVYFPGTPGCGKSTAASDFINKYLPYDTIVYIFSTQPAERSYRFVAERRKIKMEPERISVLTKEMLRKDAGDRPIVCLFDDVDMLPPKLNKPVQVLIEDLLANGRSHINSQQHIHVLVTSHVANNYGKTKAIIENCDYIVIFPKGMLYKQLCVLLGKCGLDKDHVDLILKMPHRRILFRKTYPYKLKKL